MVMQKIPVEEVMITRLFNLNYLQPFYWNELIFNAMPFLTPEDREEMRQKIFDVEKMVFDTEMIREEDEEGNIVWVERIKGDLSFYDIAMALESFQDFYAFFQKEDGTVITKFDIEREMNRIKSWIYDKVYDRINKRGRVQRMF